MDEEIYNATFAVGVCVCVGGVRGAHCTIAAGRRTQVIHKVYIHLYSYYANQHCVSFPKQCFNVTQCTKEIPSLQMAAKPIFIVDSYHRYRRVCYLLRVIIAFVMSFLQAMWPYDLFGSRMIHFLRSWSSSFSVLTSKDDSVWMHHPICPGICAWVGCSGVWVLHTQTHMHGTRHTTINTRRIRQRQCMKRNTFYAT